MAHSVLLKVTLLCFLAVATYAKVYNKCELARELVNKHKVKKSKVDKWVCIARHESEFNTAAVGTKNTDQSKDHGIFQLNDKFWCSPPGNGKGCGLSCAKLQDNNIADDFACAKKVFKETQRLKGNGFNAWTVYGLHCAGNTRQYIKGCFKSKRAIPFNGTLPWVPRYNRTTYQFKRAIPFNGTLPWVPRYNRTTYQFKRAIPYNGTLPWVPRYNRTTYQFKRAIPFNGTLPWVPRYNRTTYQFKRAIPYNGTLPWVPPYNRTTYQFAKFPSP